jgi:hypothetical protein
LKRDASVLLRPVKDEEIKQFYEKDWVASVSTEEKDRSQDSKVLEELDES